LLVAGAEDEKFRDIAAAMAQRMPGGETAIVPAAGHNTHLENPVEFGRTANDFLCRMCAVRGRQEHRDAIRLAREGVRGRFDGPGPNFRRRIS
jgi:hypothetical protein